MHLPQPLQEMPSFPTLRLSGRNKKLKASDVESPGRNGCWSGSPNQPTFHVMSRSSDQCHEMFISQKSSSIGRGGCRRGWPMAFLLSNSPIRSSISILPALGIVGVRWPMQTISLDWTFILTLAVQFTRDSTTFLRLFSNLNPSPLTTFFKQTMTWLMNFRPNFWFYLRVETACSKPWKWPTFGIGLQRTQQDKRWVFDDCHMEAITWKSQKPLAVGSLISVAWFSTLHLDPIIKSLAAVQAGD